jgi:hypothetical protein
LRIALQKFFRDGYARKQMTARSSSRNGYPHRFSPARACCLFCAVYVLCVEMLSKIPTVIMLITNDEPP